MARHKAELTVASKEILVLRQKEKYLDQQKQESLKNESLSKGIH